jgi:hypothetical protein
MANALTTGGKVTASKSSPEETRWRAEDDMRTLMRADEIKADKARLKACAEHAKKQASAVSKVAEKRK